MTRKNSAGRSLRRRRHAPVAAIPRRLSQAASGSGRRAQPVAGHLGAGRRRSLRAAAGHLQRRLPLPGRPERSGRRGRGRMLMIEPEGRNTAPAVSRPRAVSFREDPDALMLVLPSDHVIADVDGFQAMIAAGARAAEAGWLVTFGMTPDRAETGYGYINRAEALSRGARLLRRRPLRREAGCGDGRKLSCQRRLRLEQRHVSVFRRAADRGDGTLRAGDRDDLPGGAGGGRKRIATFLRLEAEAFAREPQDFHRPCGHGKDRSGGGAARRDRLERCRIVGRPVADSLRCGTSNTLVGDVLALDSRGSYLHSEKPCSPPSGSRTSR